MAHNDEQGERRVIGFVGVGLDNKDEHKRVTRSDHFLLIGGSPETHESMQEIAIRFGRSLEQRGKRLQDTAPEEAIDLLNEAADK